MKKIIYAAFILFSANIFAQNTYTYSSGGWTDQNSNVVSGPFISSANSLVLNSNYDINTTPTEQLLDNTTYTTGSGATWRGQSFKSKCDCLLEGISVFKDAVGSGAGEDYSLRLYKFGSTLPTTGTNVVGFIPSNSTFISSETFTTTSTSEQQIVFTTPFQLEKDVYYFFALVEGSVNSAWDWLYQNTNVYGDGYFMDIRSTGSYYNIKSGDIKFSLLYSFNPNNLTIGSSVNTNIDGNMSISGALTNSGSLTLNANSSNYAQLKVGGTITNNGTITQNQYISSTGHHGISSPMTGGFGTTSGTSSTLYAYDAANGAYFSPANTTVTTAGAGYFAPVGTGGYLTAAGTFSTTGTPNTSHTHSLGYATSVATGGSGNGWNLIGNPYTCGLDWTGVTKTNVNDAFYIWDAATSTYKYYVNGVSAPSGTYAGSALASGVIPPMQAFWVQATASGASVVSTMASHGTVASSPTFYKTQPDNIILTVSNLSDAAKGDVLWVKNVYGTTNSFEGEEDAWKMTNYGGYPNIYTYDNGQKMAINATDLMQTGIIPVGMSAPVPGVKYVFHAEQVTSNGAYSVILEDKLLNTFTDLDQEGYTFTYGAWSQEGPRFALHINQATVGQEEQSVLAEVKLFQNGDRLIIHGDAAMHTSYSILTLDGRLMTEGFLQAGKASVMAPKAGLYIVQLNGQQASVGRVMIQ